MLINGSATRDERAFPDPDRFDIDRIPSGHNVNFGYGVHSCLGAALARMEGRIALDVMLDMMPEYRVDPAGLRRSRWRTWPAGRTCRSTWFADATRTEGSAMTMANHFRPLWAVLVGWLRRSDSPHADGDRCTGGRRMACTSERREFLFGFRLFRRCADGDFRLRRTDDERCSLRRWTPRNVYRVCPEPAPASKAAFDRWP